jgi:type VI secretion system protein ImpM
MLCSLYGKVPAKRDFIAVRAPREFLNAWEPWLQAAISASRTTLGNDWQPAFLTAPIWRFWLGADICGRSVIGAFMSSLDGVGRYFPLTLFACADEDAAIPPPEYGAQDGWFDKVETFLMSTLDQGAQFETMTAQLGALPPPSQERLKDASPKDAARITEEASGEKEPPGETDKTGEKEPEKEPPAKERPGLQIPAASGSSANGLWALPADGQSFNELFGSIRRCDHARIYAGSTFWWTIGGEGIAPVALSGKGMPDPFLFSAMLTGRFAGGTA